MIVVNYRDRLGNKMFQYALGRIIAEHLGYRLLAEPLEGMPGTFEEVTGAEHTNPIEQLAGQKINLDAVLNDATPRKIVLNGWFQRYEYFTAHRERMRQWFRLSNEHVVCCDADLVLNIRRTDYIHLGWALPYEFYLDAIERALPHGGRITIVTDDHEDIFFRRFKKWRPTFFHGTPLQQMSFMTNAPRLVMSASTFSWWPTFLGNQELVICPNPSFGNWNANSGYEVNLIDPDRFVCLTCPLPYKPNFLETTQQFLRLYQLRCSNWANKHLGLRLSVKDRIFPPPAVPKS